MPTLYITKLFGCNCKLVLYTDTCILAINFIYLSICSMHHKSCIIHHSLCIFYHAPSIIHNALCIMHHKSFSMLVHLVTSIIHHPACILNHASFEIHQPLCKMYQASFIMHHASSNNITCLGEWSILGGMLLQPWWLQWGWIFERKIDISNNCRLRFVKTCLFLKSLVFHSIRTLYPLQYF